MEDFEHCFVADSERGWRAALVPLLEGWIGCLEQHVHDPVLGRHYTPFSYNERALVGFLAAAAWRGGFLAMEEFRTRKGRSRGYGRGDLVLKLGDTVVCLEAKRLGINLSRHPTPWPPAMKALDRARWDAVELALDHAAQLSRAGVVFVAPRIDATDSGRFERLRERLIDQVTAHAHASPEVRTPAGYVPDFWAAYLPAGAMEMRQAEVPGKRWMGVILVGSTLDAE